MLQTQMKNTLYILNKSEYIIRKERNINLKCKTKYKDIRQHVEVMRFVTFAQNNKTKIKIINYI